MFTMNFIKAASVLTLFFHNHASRIQNLCSRLLLKEQQSITHNCISIVSSISHGFHYFNSLAMFFRQFYVSLKNDWLYIKHFDLEDIHNNYISS